MKEQLPPIHSIRKQRVMLDSEFARLDKKLVTHDVIMRDVYEKLRPLLNPPPVPAKEMGFRVALKKRSGGS